MNLCILYGQIVSEIGFDFFYNSKKHISVVSFKLLPKNSVISSENNQTILVKAYDENADIIYQNFQKMDYIYMEGYVTKENVEIKNICKTK